MKRYLYIIGITLTLFMVQGQWSIVNGQSYTLEQILDSARHNNITLRNAQRSVEAAKEQRKEAFTKYFPTVSSSGFWFNANKGMAKMDINLSEYITPEMAASIAQSGILPAEALASLGQPMSMEMMKKGVMGNIMAMQPVFAGGQIVNGNKLAKVGEEVSRLQLQLSENEVEKTAEQYYWQIVSLEEKLKTIDAVEAMLADINKDVTVAVKAGVAMRNDLLQVELRQNDVESQRLTLNNNISILRMILAQYCGLQTTDFTLSYNPEVQSPMLEKQDHQLALLNTPEYQLLGKQVEASKLQHKIAIGQNLPTVGVGGGLVYHNMLESGRSFGMVMATVSIPISDWWGGSHNIKRKKIERQKAIDQLADNSELLKINMQSAWNNLQEAYQQLTIAQRSIDQATENLRLNRDYYQAGTITMSDLLEAQLLYQQSLDKRTDAYTNYQNMLLAYRQSVGE
ncbi:MAG: TolC family protein [Bacteroidaceae bacterium]|nr:TolC family protein [Bacteroidaceae bacterium]